MRRSRTARARRRWSQPRGARCSDPPLHQHPSAAAFLLLRPAFASLVDTTHTTPHKNNTTDRDRYRQGVSNVAVVSGKLGAQLQYAYARAPAPTAHALPGLGPAYAVCLQARIFQSAVAVAVPRVCCLLARVCAIPTRVHARRRLFDALFSGSD